MLYFSEPCVKIKIHHEPSNLKKKKIEGNTKTTCFVSTNVQFSKWVIPQLPVLYPSKWVIPQLPVLYPSMFNFLPDFVTSKLPFCIAKIRYAM